MRSRVPIARNFWRQNNGETQQVLGAFERRRTRLRRGGRRPRDGIVDRNGRIRGTHRIQDPITESTEPDDIHAEQDKHRERRERRFEFRAPPSSSRPTSKRRRMRHSFWSTSNTHDRKERIDIDNEEFDSFRGVRISRKDSEFLLTFIPFLNLYYVRLWISLVGQIPYTDDSSYLESVPLLRRSSR